jgi:hypothetical protein
VKQLLVILTVARGAGGTVRRGWCGDRCSNAGVSVKLHEAGATRQATSDAQGGFHLNRRWRAQRLKARWQCHDAAVSVGPQRRDPVLRWRECGAVSSRVVVRSTPAPHGERECAVGKVTEYRLKDTSLDGLLPGVKAVRFAGVDSLAAPYVASVPPLN